MTIRTLSTAAALGAAALTAAAAPAGAETYGASMPKGWDSGKQAGKSTYANECQVGYRFGRDANGRVYAGGQVGKDTACRVSFGLFYSGWLGGKYVEIRPTSGPVRVWDHYSLYDLGDSVYLKITTINKDGKQSGEIHDVNHK